ncbi:PP2C family protein-serine/threonine phosphatase [Streptomyces sp. MS06]|uniref:PP2C family protein-serine/threonine phosphatase n=1 Tax=Streptomyces sp. MS06 TaxID=3385974 RepID=UPI0039A3BFF8
MPSPLSADRPSAQPPGRGSVEALLSQARRLKGAVDAVRREAQGEGSEPEQRWQRALYELALHQLDHLDSHLAELRDGPLPGPEPESSAPAPGQEPGSLLSRVGTAEWNLLTDEASWSAELYRILGHDPALPPLTLDELPSLVLEEDRPRLTATVTDCLIDGRPIDGEFRILLPDGTRRTLHMMGEPVLGADGGTASMWAVLRDVSELRRSRQAVAETRDSLRHQRDRARTEHRVAVELQEAVLPARHGSLRLPRDGRGVLDLAAHCLPATAGAAVGGNWYDVLDLPGGDTLLSVGDLAGHGPEAASGTAMLLGALRGIALADQAPGRLMTLLNRLLDATAQPALGSALCCRYRPGTRTLEWAQAGHPAPLLYRDGTGRRLRAPDGVLLGAPPGPAYGQAEDELRAGDLLLLHTDGLVPQHGGTATGTGLLDLADRFRQPRSAEDCVRAVVDEFGTAVRTESACVLVARVVS